MFIKKISAVLLFMFLSFRGLCQSIPKPEVGKQMPDFTITDVTHYPKKQVSLKDFKGKWLFMDFWFTGCKTCITSFPKVNALYKEFSNELTWMMVGMNDKKHNKGIKDLYEKFRSKQSLEMPSSYDSILVKNWGIHSMPHIYVIDPNGILRFITDGRDAEAENIRLLLAGKEVSLYPKEIERPKFVAGLENFADSSKHPPLFFSMLSKWNGENQISGFNLDEYERFTTKEKENGWTAAAIPLYALYNYAYCGRWDWPTWDTAFYGVIHKEPILELSDSSLFEYEFSQQPKGLYNYYLKVPIEGLTQYVIMEEIQKTLKQVFKYDVSVEKRKMPVWKLIAGPEVKTKIATKGEVPIMPWSKGAVAAGFSTTNIPMAKLFDFLIFYIHDAEKASFIDATGITGNVDFSIVADMTDINDIKKELQKQGMDLVQSEKEMKVVVISDPKN